MANIAPGFRALPLPIAQLSLSAVLQCGQSFRWSVFSLSSTGHATESGELPPSHEYRLCLRDRVICLRQTPEMLYYRSIFPSPETSDDIIKLKEEETLAWIRDYFQLDIDLSQLYDEWSKRDPVFQKLRSRFAGIRILRQDPFECLMSFICSSNNNIGRITKMVKSLCKEYSPPLLSLSSPNQLGDGHDGQSEAYHPFPPPSALARPEVETRLRALGFGYRSGFIQRTAQMLVESHGEPPQDGGSGLQEPAEVWLESLRKMNTADARTELLKFIGVGRKVADCVLLMSMDKTEVVPVDTHVHQIAVKHYNMSGSKTKTAMTPVLYDQVNNKLALVWGDYAGWAQSVLFTSDLKTFSSYGLSTETSSITISPIASTVATPTESLAPSRSSRKRRKLPMSATTETLLESVEKKLHVTSAEVSDSGAEASLIDRVKRRRRGQ